MHVVNKLVSKWIYTRCIRNKKSKLHFNVFRGGSHGITDPEAARLAASLREPRIYSTPCMSPCYPQQPGDYDVRRPSLQTSVACRRQLNAFCDSPSSLHSQPTSNETRNHNDSWVKNIRPPYWNSVLHRVLKSRPSTNSDNFVKSGFSFESL